MYEAAFSLRTRPFSAHPADGQFLATARLEDALQGTLAAALAGTGIAAVTGPTGVGKTAFCLELAHRTVNPWKPVFLGSGRYANSGELWQAVLYALELEFTGLTPFEARLRIVEAARKRSSNGGGLFLVIDEAHLLDDQLLEELRSLTSELERGRPIIRLVLSGQLELEERLAMPELAALSQRLGSHVLLEPLKREEARLFIRHQLESAGGRLQDTFTEEALELICVAGDGNCRCINLLCDHTLLLAYVAEERPATTATVRAALEDLKGLPLQWYYPHADDDSAPAPPQQDERPLPAADTCANLPAETSSLVHDSAPIAADEQWSVEDVAVIEFGGESPNSTEFAAPIDVGVSDHDCFSTPHEAADWAPDGEEREPSSAEGFDVWTDKAMSDDVVIETCIEDPYAKLDRMTELQQVPGVAAGLPLRHPVADLAPPAAGAVDSTEDFGPGHELETDILEQIQRLHDTVQEQLDPEPREIEAWPFADGAESELDAEAAWDVIEPVEVTAWEEPAPASAAQATCPQDVPPLAVIASPDVRPNVDGSGSREQDSHGEAIHGRYASLFTRLKRRRREAAEAVWAGLSFMDG